MSKRINIIKYQLKNRLKHNLSNLMAMPQRGREEGDTTFLSLFS